MERNGGGGEGVKSVVERGGEKVNKRGVIRGG